MVEAAVSIPVLILAAMLMVRMLVFCMEVLTSGIRGHKEALKVQRAYSGALMSTYERDREVSLVRGGLLGMDVGKRIEIKAYLINEDLLARSGEVLD
jgi:hypothetical protein